MNPGPDIPQPGVPTRWTHHAAARSSDRFLQAGLLRAQAQRALTSLQRHWWIPLVSLLVFGGPGIVYSIMAPRTFRSQAVLWMGERLELPEGRMHSEELSSYLGTQVELLKSAL